MSEVYTPKRRNNRMQTAMQNGSGTGTAADQPDTSVETYVPKKSGKTDAWRQSDSKPEAQPVGGDVYIPSKKSARQSGQEDGGQPKSERKDPIVFDPDADHEDLKAAKRIYQEQTPEPELEPETEAVADEAVEVVQEPVIDASYNNELEQAQEEPSSGYILSEDEIIEDDFIPDEGNFVEFESVEDSIPDGEIPVEEAVEDDVSYEEPVEDSIPDEEIPVEEAVEEAVEDDVPYEEPAEDVIPDDEIPIEETAEETFEDEVPYEEPVEDSIPDEELSVEEAVEDEVPYEEPAEDSIPDEEPLIEEAVEETFEDEVPYEEPAEDIIPDDELPIEEAVEDTVENEVPYEEPVEDEIPYEEPDMDERSMSIRDAVAAQAVQNIEQNIDTDDGPARDNLEPISEEPVVLKPVRTERSRRPHVPRTPELDERINNILNPVQTHPVLQGDPEHPIERFYDLSTRNSSKTRDRFFNIASAAVGVAGVAVVAVCVVSGIKALSTQNQQPAPVIPIYANGGYGGYGYAPDYGSISEMRAYYKGNNLYVDVYVRPELDGVYINDIPVTDKIMDYDVQSLQPSSTPDVVPDPVESMPPKTPEPEQDSGNNDAEQSSGSSGRNPEQEDIDNAEYQSPQANADTGSVQDGSDKDIVAETHTVEMPKYGSELEKRLIQEMQERIDNGESGYLASDIVYEIVSGDTLSGISKKTGFSVDFLAAYNRISDVNKIYATSVLRYPDLEK